MDGLDGRVVRIRISCSGASCFLVNLSPAFLGFPLGGVLCRCAYTHLSLHVPVLALMPLFPLSLSQCIIGSTEFVLGSVLALLLPSDCPQKSSLLAMHVHRPRRTHISANGVALAVARTYLVTQAVDGERVYAAGHPCDPRPQSPTNVFIALRSGYMRSCRNACKY